MCNKHACKTMNSSEFSIWCRQLSALKDFNKNKSRQFNKSSTNAISRNHQLYNCQATSKSTILKLKQLGTAQNRTEQHRREQDQTKQNTAQNRPDQKSRNNVRKKREK